MKVAVAFFFATCYPTNLILSFRPKRVARSGEISARQQAEGDLPLIDKAGSSESSTSKIPTAYQWGQILQPHCVRQLPLLKGAPPSVDRALQLDFSAALEMTGCGKSTVIFHFVISTKRGCKPSAWRNLGAPATDKSECNELLRALVDIAMQLDFSTALEMTSVSKPTDPLRAPL